MINDYGHVSPKSNHFMVHNGKYSYKAASISHML